jgi:hypothetical protein
MQSQGWISATLLLTMFAGIFSAALLAFEVGLRFGKWRRERPHPESEAAARVIVTGILSMLAFVVGFTFRLGTDHFDARNQALHKEVISIGTAYHRADLLAEPERTKLRNGLREYVDLRLQGTRAANPDEVIARLRVLQETMWTQAIAAGKTANGGSTPTLLIQSMNDVIDLNAERVLRNMQSRISSGVWAFLSGISILAVAAAGYFTGLTNTRRRSLTAVAYALVLAGMIVIIADVDVPRFGHFHESNQPLIDLKVRLTPLDDKAQE